MMAIPASSPEFPANVEKKDYDKDHEKAALAEREGSIQRPSIGEGVDILYANFSPQEPSKAPRLCLLFSSIG